MYPTDGVPVWKHVGYRPTLQQVAEREEIPILVAGGGPVGLATALDLGRRGHPVLVLNALPFVAAGSRAICFSKRSLEILDRLGVGQRIVDKGVMWEKGKVFWRDDPVPLFEFDLLPVKDQKRPAFVNIQQYYVEEYLLDEIARFSNIEVRWRHEVTGVTRDDDHVVVEVETPDGKYSVRSEYLLACDGSRSSVRQLLGLGFEGRVFEENFLIADVRFKQPWPSERWFRFEPPYDCSSSLVHKQPDGVWRLDFQLGRDIDRTRATEPENVDPYVRGVIGDGTEFEYEWISLYRFQCRRMARFVHDRVIFAGDAAHVVSPFGARGCNGGLQDADNLGWKLDLVLRQRAPASLLESYDEEATLVADENILHSSRATDFMTPKSAAARTLRDAVLGLSRHYEFARPFVNSGRLSQAVSYAGSSLNAPSSDDFDCGPEPGSPCIDAPVRAASGSDWLLPQLGDRFVALVFTDDESVRNRLRSSLGDSPAVVQLAQSGDAVAGRCVDRGGQAWRRYGASPGTTYLVRPDQHVAGRWCEPDVGKLGAALARATAN